MGKLLKERSLAPNFRSLHHSSLVTVDEIAGYGRLGGSWHSSEHMHTAIQVTYLCPGSSMMAHWISEGGCKFQKRILGSTVCVTPARQPHSMEWDEAHGSMMMLIKPSLLDNDGDELRADTAWTSEGLYGESNPFLEHLCALLVDAGRDGRLPSRLQVESTAVLMLVHLKACKRLCSRAAKEWGRLGRVREFIHANLNDDISIATLARIARTSPFHFGRLFKANTDLTPHQYVMHERIQVAKRLLAETSVAIAEIAQECGFATQAHLTTTFRKHVGDTPRRFRAVMGSDEAQ